MLIPPRLYCQNLVAVSPRSNKTNRGNNVLIKPTIQKIPNNPSRRRTRHGRPPRILAGKLALSHRQVASTTPFGKNLSGHHVTETINRVSVNRETRLHRLVDVQHVGDFVPAPWVENSRVGIGLYNTGPVVAAHGLGR